MKRNVGKFCGLIFAIFIFLSGLSIAIGSPIFAQEKVGPSFNVGVLGTFSGTSAAWGLTLKYSTQAVAEMYNRKGGFVMEGVRYPIKVLAEDDKFDTKLARSGAEKLIFRDKLKYIIGPVTSPTCAGAQVVTEPAKVIMIGYGFNKALYLPQNPHTIFAMVAPFQSAPILYKFLMEKYNAKTLSLVAKNYDGALKTREWCTEAANKLGLKIVSAKETYESDTVDFFPVMGSVVKANPDIIDLTSPGPGDAAMAAKAARQLGYKGIICMQTGGDLKTFKEIAGNYAEGMICIGGATMPLIRTPYMNELMDIYKKIAGEWNEESATKIYPLEMILETIRVAGVKAFEDTEAFRAAMPKVAYKNPYIQGNPIMKYVGKEEFGQANQIGVPVVYVQVQGDKFEVIAVKSLEK